MTKHVNPGDVVQSTAGKDKDKLFLVVDVIDRYAYLIDGKTKKQSNPKKKSKKHIKVISTTAQPLVDEIKKGSMVGAKRIKQTICNKKI